MTAPRVLVIGGYGVFGQRLCARLLRGPAVELLAAGRSANRAAAASDALKRQFPDQSVKPLAVDATAPLAETLKDLRPLLVINAAGPFQERDYRVAEACIAAGCHYIDLADGRDFVTGITRLDAAARAAGVLVVSGASSVPALSAASVDHLRRGLTRLDSIAIGIAPGNRAPRGRAVVEGILGYSGKPLQVWQDGAWQRRFGWQGLRRRRLPGLGPRWFATCDVPDLALFPQRYAGVQSVAFQAGLELPLLHLGLWALTWPVRWGLIGSLRPLAAPLLAIAKALERFGSDRGGMFVEVRGLESQNRPCRRFWSLCAESGHGPVIPVVPAAILTARIVGGEIRETGARPCLDVFTLSEFQDSVSDLDIRFSEEN